MNQSLEIYKDLSNPNEHINMQFDRSVDKNEEEEMTDVSIAPSIEEEYKVFIEDCHNDDKKINIVLVKQFILLFSENPTLSLVPISDTDFFDLIILKFVKIKEEDIKEPEDTIILLQSLTILLHVLALDFNFLRKEFIPQLIFMMSTSNDAIVELSLHCLLILSEENIINRFLIRQIDQNKSKEFIENLWKVFNHYLTDTDSSHICQMIIKILGTFYQNNENELVHLILEKLNSILDSDEFALLAVNEIKKYNNHARIMADCNLIISIQVFLRKLHNQYQSKIEEFKLFISELKENESQNEKTVEILKSFENSIQESTFSWSNFHVFLENEGLDNEYLLTFNKIDDKMNEIIQGQTDSMNILNSFVDQQLIFIDLNSELLFLFIQKFDYQRSDALVSETVHFIKQAITYILPFSTLFFDCLYKSGNENDDLFDLLVHFSLNSPYKTRIEVGLLFTQLIRKADKVLITKLFEKRKIDLLFQMISEFQDFELFNEMAESLFKLIDFKFGDQMKDNLQSVVTNVEEMAENENNDVSWRAKLLLKKIKEIINVESENENDPA